MSIFTVFLKNRIFISKIRRSKVADYAALKWNLLSHALHIKTFIYQLVYWPSYVSEVIKKIMLNSPEHEIIMLISVKMPTIVGILTLISMINTKSETLKACKICIFHHFTFYQQLKFHAQVSWAWKKLISVSWA